MGSASVPLFTFLKVRLQTMEFRKRDTQSVAGHYWKHKFTTRSSESTDRESWVWSLRHSWRRRSCQQGAIKGTSSECTFLHSSRENPKPLQSFWSLNFPCLLCTESTDLGFACGFQCGWLQTHFMLIIIMSSDIIWQRHSLWSALFEVVLLSLKVLADSRFHANNLFNKKWRSASWVLTTQVQTEDIFFRDLISNDDINSSVPEPQLV